MSNDNRLTNYLLDQIEKLTDERDNAIDERVRTSNTCDSILKTVEGRIKTGISYLFGGDGPEEVVEFLSWILQGGDLDLKENSNKLIEFLKQKENAKENNDEIYSEESYCEEEN